ncbi:MAG: ABC transporter ATP-binding protein [Ilumatobacteraceae bacterium]
MTVADHRVPVVRAEHVAFTYTPGVPVLTDISFEVHRGEVLMILGANGCGKSTLMRTLLNEQRRSSGLITLDGTDIATLKPVEMARRVAMVFQDHHAPFPFSVMDVVSMGRAPHLRAFGTPSRGDVRLCEEALEIVGLGRLRDETYTLLSGGERQLVLIARALAQQTELVMMDEPTSHLDYRNAAVIIKTANQLAREQGKAVIIVTHLPDQAFYYPSKAALMKGGRFLSYGDSREVLTEENLSEIYDMGIRVLTTRDEVTDEEVVMCRPVLDTL